MNLNELQQLRSRQQQNQKDSARATASLEYLREQLTAAGLSSVDAARKELTKLKKEMNRQQERYEEVKAKADEKWGDKLR